MSDDNCAQELTNQETAIPHGQESGAPNRNQQEVRIPPSVCACGFSGLENGLVVTLDQLIASSETVIWLIEATITSNVITILRNEVSER